MKTTAKRYIDATEKATAQLAQSFKCTAKYVYMCLTYRRDNETARKIRYTAVKVYGATPMLHVPECETMHDTTEGGRQVMRQVFDNGAILRVDKRTGEAWITNRNGKEVERRERINFAELDSMQVIAENL